MRPKRIILMYISEVSGHHSATLAIEKAIKELSAASEILNINSFNYTNPISEKIVNKIYMGVIKRAPKIWDYLYDNQKVVKGIEKLKKTVHKFNSPKFKALFDRFRPDAVVCAQAYPCGMVADYKKTYNSQIPLIAVLTDYVPHSYWIYDNIDYYITPSETVSARLANKGVARAKIRALGIPFDPDFSRDMDKGLIKKKLGLSADKPVVLIMGGGQGLGPIKSVVNSLEGLPFDIQELIVTGTNAKLYKSLKKRIKRLKNQVKLYRYVNNINEMMTASDLLISKPGGVTTAEALAKDLPMIIVKPIPGQEANNTAYLTESGAAIKIDDPRQIHATVRALLSDPLELEKFKEGCRKIKKPNASIDIASLILGL